MHTNNAGWISGDYWMNCQVCGFDYRRSQMRKRWDGLWTCETDWNERQPQDFVKGVKDRQSVPVPMPDPTRMTTTTTLTANASKGATTVSVASASRLVDNASIGIDLDDGTIQWTVATDVTLLVVTLLEELRGAAASGNTVYVPGSSFQLTPISSTDL